MLKQKNNEIMLHCIVLIGITFLSAQVAAQDEPFALYAHGSVSFDDNVFLLSDEELAINPIDGQTDARDTITELGAGFRSDITSLSQRYYFSANAFRRNYADFGQLDFTGGRVDAQWDWYLSQKWDGEISYLFNREQSNLGDQRLVNGDVYDLNQASLKAIRHTSNNNQIYLSTVLQRKEYEQRQNLDNEQADITLGYKYISAKQNSVAFELRNSQGDSLDRVSPNALISSSNLTSYDQDSANLIMAWKLGIRDELKIEAGYVSRDQEDQLSQFDYSGLTYDLSHEWNVTNKTQITWGFGRNLNNTENTQTLFTIQDYGFINAKFDATQKIELNLNLRYRDVDFTQIISDRDDQISNIEFRSIYHWSSSTDLVFSIKQQSRDSSIIQNEYDNVVTMLEISYNMD